MKWLEDYRAKRTTAEEAVGRIATGNRVYLGAGCAVPHSLVEAMTARADELRDVEVVHVLTVGQAPYVQPDLAESFRVNALFVVVAATVGTFVGTAERGGHRLSQRSISLILGVAVAAALALGLAGTEGIDVALRAGLVLWLLSYGQASLLSSSEKRGVGRPLAVLGGGLMLTGAGHILFIDPDRGLMLTFMLAGLATAALVAAGSWGWAVVKKRS